MDRYTMNRPDPRSRYQKNPAGQNQMPQISSQRTVNQFCSQDNMYRHVDQMIPAMAYVPMQEFNTTFDSCRALKMGTVFPELCKPFCGKRGVRR
ncbi:MAG: spore coat associated protein CotJA [Ruminococcus sp.]